MDLKHQTFPKIHTIKGLIQSIYLVEYPDKMLLLDGTCRCDVKTVNKFVTEKLNKTMDDIKLIVVTHMHPDHAGGASKFKKKYSIPITANPACNSWYTGANGLLQHKVDISLAYYVVKEKERGFKNLAYKRFIPIDHPVRDNDTLPGFEDWRVIETPGHTNHDINLYNEKLEMLYVADNILKIKNKYVPPFPIVYPDRMIATLGKISKLKVKTILMAHGGIATIDNLNKITDQLIEKVGSRLDAFPKIIHKLSCLAKKEK